VHPPQVNLLKFVQVRRHPLKAGAVPCRSWRGTITEAGWVMQYPACLGYGRNGRRHGTSGG
jgi:hypothetical protein